MPQSSLWLFPYTDSELPDSNIEGPGHKSLLNYPIDSTSMGEKKKNDKRLQCYGGSL